MKVLSLPAFAGQVLLERFQKMTAEVRAVSEGDVEALHRMRVASRRLRTGLRLFSDLFEGRQARRWRREISALARSLGDGRNVDVQMESLESFLAAAPPKLRPGPERLLLRLRQRRQALQPTIAAEVGRFFGGPMPAAMTGAFRGLLERSLLEPSEEDLSGRAARSLLPLLAGLLSYGNVVGTGDAEGLHGMRIAAKRLRYAAEIYGSHGTDGEALIDVTGEIQTLLGRIHDGDVWLAFLPGFIDDERSRTAAYYGHGRVFPRLLPGLTAFSESVAADRAERIEAFRRRWAELDRGGFWADSVARLQQACEVRP